jgi:hypothetical protein
LLQIDMTGRVLAFVSTAVAALALAASAGADQAAPAALSGFVCHTASNPLNRYIEVTATMQPIAGTADMKMRFQLQRRLPLHSFHQVFGGDLDKWRQFPSGPLAPWEVKKPVVNLPAPAVYRFRVSFLWLGSSRDTIGFLTLLSQTCRQPL